MMKNSRILFYSILFYSILFYNRAEDGLEVKIHLTLVHLRTDMADCETYHTIILLLNDFTEAVQQEEGDVQLEGVRQMMSEVSSYS